VVREVVETACATMVAPVDTFTTATEHCRNRQDFQLSVGVVVFTSCLAATGPPGERSAGGITVKDTLVRSAAARRVGGHFDRPRGRSIQEGPASRKRSLPGEQKPNCRGTNQIEARPRKPGP